LNYRGTGIGAICLVLCSFHVFTGVGIYHQKLALFNKHRGADF